MTTSQLFCFGAIEYADLLITIDPLCVVASLEKKSWIAGFGLAIANRIFVTVEKCLPMLSSRSLGPLFQETKATDGSGNYLRMGALFRKSSYRMQSTA
jgi:hypothetical protein